MHDATRSERVGYHLARQLLYRHVQAVANIAPKSSQHLIVELALIALEHELISLLQALCSYLVGTLALCAYHIGIGDGTLAEHHYYYDEYKQRHKDCCPISY